MKCKDTREILTEPDQGLVDTLTFCLLVPAAPALLVTGLGLGAFVALQIHEWGKRTFPLQELGNGLTSHQMALVAGGLVMAFTFAAVTAVGVTATASAGRAIASVIERKCNKPPKHRL